MMDIISAKIIEVFSVLVSDMVSLDFGEALFRNPSVIFLDDILNLIASLYHFPQFLVEFFLSESLPVFSYF